MPIVETEFARELFSDLKRARRLAQQEIRKAQGNQKKQYDKSAKESVVKENDLVMLKVEPRFKLDRTFRGPYRVEGVTSTNVVIRPVNDPTAEPWNVSIQRVSKCNQSLSSSSPWFGHGRGSNRRRRQVLKPREPQSDAGEKSDSEQTFQTKRGRTIHRPARYRDAVPQGSAKKGGGGCKTVAAHGQRTEESGKRVGGRVSSRREEKCDHEAWKDKLGYR